MREDTWVSENEQVDSDDFTLETVVPPLVEYADEELEHSRDRCRESGPERICSAPFSMGAKGIRSGRDSPAPARVMRPTGSNRPISMPRRKTWCSSIARPDCPAGR